MAGQALQMHDGMASEVSLNDSLAGLTRDPATCCIPTVGRTDKRPCDLMHTNSRLLHERAPACHRLLVGLEGALHERSGGCGALNGQLLCQRVPSCVAHGLACRFLGWLAMEMQLLHMSQLSV